MNVQAIINALIVLSLPALFLWASWTYRVWVQGLPEHQDPRLRHFAEKSVKYVEMEHPDATDKKALALALTADQFRHRHLPVPHPDDMSIAVGAAMFDIKQLKTIESNK